MTKPHFQIPKELFDRINQVTQSLAKEEDSASALVESFKMVIPPLEKHAREVGGVLRCFAVLGDGLKVEVDTFTSIGRAGIAMQDRKNFQVAFCHIHSLRLFFLIEHAENAEPQESITFIN